MSAEDSTDATSAPVNFIRNRIDADLAAGKNEGAVATRFPPEPNGYLHIGHAKSICLNFGVARDYKGRCNLRFDDTNPVKEDAEFITAIQRDVAWLGFEWDELRHASDYFDQLYDYACELIRGGNAYVDSSTAEQMREMRGTLTSPGTPSPYRERSVDENLDLFARMKAGEFDEGAHVLRAKIDMASGNINLRDPALYRIRKVSHVRTGDTWSIYPMYDYTHCLSDAIEGITHSLCTLEFEDHRPLYDWVLDTLKTPVHPQQIEFGPLLLEYTLLSKRYLAKLIDDAHVAGWDDPRMPTLAGLRRRGFPPAAIRRFCDLIGVTKNEAWIDMGVLEGCVRDELNLNAERRLGVLDPLKVVITDLPEDHHQTLEFQNHPQDETRGSRPVDFTREIWVEREDFAEVPPPKWQRLVEGGEVRLRGSYVIKCESLIRDATGKVTELHCTHDPDTLGKKPEGRKVKGVIHWVSAAHSVLCEVRLYDRLYSEAHPSPDHDPASILNPNSLVTMPAAQVEASLATMQSNTPVQFERLGYFITDSKDHQANRPVFNRVISLRDTWARG